MSYGLRVWILATLLMSGIYASAQIPISFDEEITITLSPDRTRETFVFQGAASSFAAVSAIVDERTSPILLTINKPGGAESVSNSEINFPFFQGAYIYTTTPVSGDYEIVVESPEISEPMEITILVTFEQVDPEFQPLTPGSRIDATLGPEGDLDFFELFLPADFSVLLSVTTPNNIFDSLMGLFDPSGELIAVNDDFIERQSSLILSTSVSGFYTVGVSGALQSSVGPYTIFANTIRELEIGDPTNGRLRIPGDVVAYEVSLLESQTYDFSLESSDGIEATLALVAPDMQVITAGAIGETTGERFIPGFTPLRDESLYLMVFANDREQTGTFTLSATVNEDDEENRFLQLNETVTSEIGPIDDVDVYQFIAEANTPYSIWVDPTWHLLDPALVIRDDTETIVAQIDDAVEGVDALLSSFEFPSAGTYIFEVMGSPNQPQPQQRTGVYNITVVTGAPFDVAPPRIVEPNFDVTSTASGYDIRFSSRSVFDDSFPIDLTFVVERSGEVITSSLSRTDENIVSVNANPDDIVFVSARDNADSTNETIQHVLPAPSVVSVVTGQTLALAVSAENEWIAADSRTGTVFQILPNGATETIYAGNEGGGGTFGLNALAFNSQGELFVSDAASNSILQIIDEQTATPVVRDLAFPTDIAFDGNGSMYIAQIGTDVIETWTADGERALYSQGVRNPSAIAFSPNGLLYVVNSDRGQSTVFELAPDGTATPFVQPFAETLEGLAFDTDGNLYTIDGILGVLYRISPEGEIRLFTRGLSGPSDIAFGRGDSGKILYATNLGSIQDIYAQRFISIPTGRWGLALPFGTQTRITDWFLR